MARRRRPSPQTVAVLDALAAKGPDWTYGYDLCRELGLKAGTVYPMLIRLAERGEVETAWEEEPPQGRPPRHLYRLSATGAEVVRTLHEAEAEAGAERARRPSPPPRRPAAGGAVAGAGA